jgi:hypothetical protein
MATTVLFTAQRLEMHWVASAEVDIPELNTIVGLYANGMTWPELVEDCLEACRQAYGWNGQPPPEIHLKFKIKD